MVQCRLLACFEGVGWIPLVEVSTLTGLSLEQPGLAVRIVGECGRILDVLVVEGQALAAVVFFFGSGHRVVFGSGLLIIGLVLFPLPQSSLISRTIRLPLVNTPLST